MPEFGYKQWDLMPMVGVTGNRCSSLQSHPALSIVIPFRSVQPGTLNALISRWMPLAGDRIEVIICDGSPGATFDQEENSAWQALRRLPVDRSCYSYANDKVNGLCTGVAAAGADAVLICDDDCNLSPKDLDILLSAPLAGQAFKILAFPSSFTFLESLEAARSIISNGMSRYGDPSPAYLARRHTLLTSLRYPVGECLFDDYMLENELRCAVTVITHPEVQLKRDVAPPAKWGEQQVRYAYEDLSAVLKTACFLSLPWLVGLVATLGATYLVMILALLVATSCCAASLGLRRCPLAERYPAWIVCLAPFWVAVRACAVPLALGLLLTGGFPYGGRRILRPACVRMWEW